MARHRSRLRRAIDPKPKVHGLFAAITRGRPGMARLFDFFPDFGRPPSFAVLHDDEVINPISAPRYSAALALISEHNRERVQSGPGIPPFPRLRRLVWQAGETYFPGAIIKPVDRKGGRIVSFTETGPTNWSTSRPRLWRRAPATISGRVIAIPFMSHYGHLLTDILGPIAFAIARGLISRADPVTVIGPSEDNPVSAAFISGLCALGYARGVHRLGPLDSAVAATSLHAEVLCSSAEHRYAMPEVTDLLREIFQAGGSDPDGHPRPSRVYLTRGAAKLRRLLGEAELIAGLRQRGFEIFESTWTNHGAQLAVFSSFDLMIGVHGAGLANVIFGKPTARLIELQACNARKTTGLFWAACAGMDYACLLGGPEGERQSFRIEPAKTLAEIDRLIAS